MQRQMGYQLKKDSKINELLFQKQMQEVEDCTFQPNMLPKRQSSKNHVSNKGGQELRDNKFEN